jgi:tripartite-type tricarboxylate transporter receptor subunit TctC
VQELIAFARRNPGKLSFSSAGTGTSQHMGGELLKQMAGTFIVHIPYRGSGPAVQDVIAGQVDFGIDTLVATAAHIKAGTLRALAVTAGQRVKGFDSIPTIAESGVPGYDVVSWQTVHAPAGTPRAIVDRLQGEIAKVLQQPDIRQRLDTLGLEPSGMTSDQLLAFETAEREKWAKVVKVGGIKVE